MRISLITATIVAVVAVAAVSSPADARRRHHHHHGYGYSAGGFVAGALLGSARSLLRDTTAAAHITAGRTQARLVEAWSIVCSASALMTLVRAPIWAMMVSVTPVRNSN